MTILLKCCNDIVGAVIFYTDLIKHLHVDVRLEFMAVSSYGSSTVSSGAVKIVMDTRTNIEGQHVLVTYLVPFFALHLPPLKLSIARHLIPEFFALLFICKIVEDIVDSGYTLKYLKNLLQGRNPASLEVCVLLRKPERLKVSAEELPVKYIGFDIPDKWVIPPPPN